MYLFSHTTRKESLFQVLKGHIVYRSITLHSSEYAMDVVKLADEFRNEGVVGIDVAGDEAEDVDSNGEEHFHPSIVAAYEVYFGKSGNKLKKKNFDDTRNLYQIRKHVAKGFIELSTQVKQDQPMGCLR